MPGGMGGPDCMEEDGEEGSWGLGEGELAFSPSSRLLLRVKRLGVHVPRGETLHQTAECLAVRVSRGARLKVR